MGKIEISCQDLAGSYLGREGARLLHEEKNLLIDGRDKNRDELIQKKIEILRNETELDKVYYEFDLHLIAKYSNKEIEIRARETKT